MRGQSRGVLEILALRGQRPLHRDTDVHDSVAAGPRGSLQNPKQLGRRLPPQIASLNGFDLCRTRPSFRLQSRRAPHGRRIRLPQGHGGPDGRCPS